MLLNNISIRSKKLLDENNSIRDKTLYRKLHVMHNTHGFILIYLENS